MALAEVLTNKAVEAGGLLTAAFPGLFSGYVSVEKLKLWEFPHVTC